MIRNIGNNGLESYSIHAIAMHLYEYLSKHDDVILDLPEIFILQRTIAEQMHRYITTPDHNRPGTVIFVRDRDEK